MKVFVTGAEGFIGSHLVEELVRGGHEVTALAQYNSFNSQGWLASLPTEVMDAVSIIHGDVRDAEFMREVIRGHQRVAHLAALIAIPYSYVAPSSYLETNIRGTLNVLEAAKANNVERIIHTSTSEVYGSAQYVPIDEAHGLVGQSPYSASKIAADQLAYSYWSSFGLPVTTIRPFNTYGPRQSQRAFIPSVMVQLLSGESTLRLGALDPTRDLTFVKDTARGFAAVIASDLGPGEVFNMGSGFEVSMREVVDIACQISGANPEVVVDQGRIRPANSEVERLLSDSSKMKDTFGWEPHKKGLAGLREGLQETFDWLRKNHSHAGYNASQYIV